LSPLPARTRLQISEPGFLTEVRCQQKGVQRVGISRPSVTLALGPDKEPALLSHSSPSATADLPVPSRVAKRQNGVRGATCTAGALAVAVAIPSRHARHARRTFSHHDIRPSPRREAGAGLPRSPRGAGAHDPSAASPSPEHRSRCTAALGAREYRIGTRDLAEVPSRPRDRPRTGTDDRTASRAGH
jgi:hypothetical protein